MRKNPKPVNICVLSPDLLDAPETRALEEKGHRVWGALDGSTDVIIGPRCWRIDPALGHLDKQLDMMLEGVRNIKYPKKKEGKDAS